MTIMARHGNANLREATSTQRKSTSRTSTPTRSTLRTPTTKKSSQQESNPRKETTPNKDAGWSKLSAKNVYPKQKAHKIDASLRRRAQLLINDRYLPSQTRAMVRYGLTIKDPYLTQVVERIEAGELLIERLYLEEPH
jgi:hypothetical protein